MEHTSVVWSYCASKLSLLTFFRHFWFSDLHFQKYSCHDSTLFLTCSFSGLLVVGANSAFSLQILSLIIRITASRVEKEAASLGLKAHRNITVSLLTSHVNICSQSTDWLYNAWSSCTSPTSLFVCWVLLHICSQTFQPYDR